MICFTSFQGEVREDGISVGQCGAVWCKCGAVWCSVVRCVAAYAHDNTRCNTHCNTYCNTLQHTQVKEDVIIVADPDCAYINKVGRIRVCCSVLQCVAVCCSVLQCVTVCCSVLQCVAVCCSALQCAAVVYAHECVYINKTDYPVEEGAPIHIRATTPLLSCIAVCCSVVKCVAVCCNVLSCFAVCYSVRCVGVQTRIRVLLLC